MVASISKINLFTEISMTAANKAIDHGLAKDRKVHFADILLVGQRSVEAMAKRYMQIFFRIGAAILHQPTKEGLKAALVEQQDYAWATSSRSTKWVHGGIKYLTQGYVGLALKAVKERQSLLADAPGLVDNLELVLASYRQDWRNRWMNRVGLFIYDLMGGGLRRH